MWSDGVIGKFLVRCSLFLVLGSRFGGAVALTSAALTADLTDFTDPTVVSLLTSHF